MRVCLSVLGVSRCGGVAARGRRAGPGPRTAPDRGGIRREGDAGASARTYRGGMHEHTDLGMPRGTAAPTAPTSRPAVTPRELRGDLWLAVGIFIGGVISAWLGAVSGLFGDESPDVVWGVVYAAALAAPLAVRRRLPCASLVAVSIVYFVGMSAHIPELYAGQVALFLAMYTVGAWVDDRRRAMIVRVVVVIGMFAWLIVTMYQSAVAPDDDTLSQAGAMSPFVAYSLLQLLINIAFFGGAYLFGERAYTQALDRVALERRTAELEREREHSAAQAVALDRVRIARELHDVVAHHVSAMGVQAGAARTVLTRDPDAARTALVGIEDAARSAIADLRRLLDTLRTSETPDADAADTTVRLDAVDALVAHANGNGLPTTLTIIGDAAPLPAVVEVNLYRIVQEALTNARRHGGTNATADVRVRYAPAHVEVEIANTGQYRPRGPAGLGLVGMRERAAASGGTLEAGPRERGGFLVRAHVPVSSPAAVLS